MDIESLTFDELDEQAMQRLVFDNDEISPILKGHIFIEKVLENLISKNLKYSKAFFKRRRTFETKLDLAKSMRILDHKHYSGFKAINNIRNSYAHTDGYHVSIKELNGFKFDWVKIQDIAFNKACQKGAGEAARISTIFLCWKAISLVKSEQTSPEIDQ